MLLLLVLSACSTTSTQTAAISIPPLCSLAKLDETFDSLEAMPPEISRDILSRFSEVTILSGEKGMAASDEPYSATGGYGPHRRFIQGGRSGGRFILLYEHDEGQRHNHAVIYESSADTPLHATANVLAQPRELCDVAQAVLINPADPRLWRDRRDW
jgi:hypothetical protein